MYERFTDRARKVYQLANQEAQRFNHDKIDVFHILVALVKEGSGVAANVLKNLDVDLRKLRLEVEKHVSPGPDWITMGKIPHTEAASCIAPFAVNEAEALGHDYVGTEHLLLGIVREEFTGMPGIAGKVLLGLGLDRTKIRDEVMFLLTHFDKPMTEHKADGPIKPSRYVQHDGTSLMNDPTFHAIMQNTEYRFYNELKQMVDRGCANADEIHRVERSMLVSFCEMLAMYGYTITRAPVYDAEGTIQIGVDMAAGRDQSVMQVWHFPAKCDTKETKEIRELAEKYARESNNRVNVTIPNSVRFGPCYITNGGKHVHNPREGDFGLCVCGERTVVPAATGTDNRWVYGEAKPHPMAAIELAEQAMGKPSHFKHALTVNELIDVEQPTEYTAIEKDGIIINPLSDGEATFMNEMADAVDQTTCTCTSLLNGHSNGCPFSSK